MNRLLAILALVFALPLAVAASDGLADLAQVQQSKLEDALARLQEQRSRIQSEQTPMALEYSELERRAAGLREALSRSRRARDSGDVDLAALRAEVGELRKARDYIGRSLFADFSAGFEASLSAGERASYGEPLRARNLFLENAEASEAEQLKRGLDMLRLAMARIRSTQGGKAYEGEALGVEGRMVKGRFLQVGPLLYFADSVGGAGWVDEGAAGQPKLVSADSSMRQSLAELARSGKGSLPIDPSLGDALALERTRDGFWEHLRKGGVWVYPIVGFALAATLVALFKLLQIYSIRQPSPLVAHDIVRALREGDMETARSLAAAQPQPTRRMLVDAVEHADESIDLVEEVMYESMLNTQPKLERFLNVIAVTAAIAPLLGLLGTVTGIIKTFKLMNVFGAGDPKPLISGISEALITTELGLALAIPALVVHALLSRKVAGVMSAMEKLSVAFVNGLSRRSGESARPNYAETSADD